MPADSTSLRELQACFQGVVPASVATCSPEGIPNVTYLSVVHCVDDSHVALSFQFFNKTRDNVLANPRVQILLLEPATMVQYRLDAIYERTETEGPTFERLRVNLDAVASRSGMQGVFRLHGADIYRVLAVEELAHDLDLTTAQGGTDFVAALETLSGRLSTCDDLEELLDTALVGLDELLDYPHAIVLFADEHCGRLFAVASRGFPRSGVGAEIAFGEGSIGVAARERRAVRLSHFRVDETLAQAVRSTAQKRGDVVAPREIALPGLPNAQCEVAAPILARDRVLGVLCVQSRQPGRLTLQDEQALVTLARYLATAIQLLGQPSALDAPPRRDYRTRTEGADPITVRHHTADDSVFVDDEYLIKGLPGRILIRLLRAYDRDGRVDFSNRELRADKSLRLSGPHDNLDARLILLRRRLEERVPAIRLHKTGRGRLRLELVRQLRLVTER